MAIFLPNTWDGEEIMIMMAMTIVAGAIAAGGDSGGARLRWGRTNTAKSQLLQRGAKARANESSRIFLAWPPSKAKLVKDTPPKN